MKRLVTIGRRMSLLACVGFSYGLSAAPNLDSARKVPGGVIFADHQQPRSFYFLETHKALLSKHAKPDFFFQINRYVGDDKTGDEDAFWVRGIISLGVSNAGSEFNYGQEKQKLETAASGPVSLLPVASSQEWSKLVYSLLANPDDDNPDVPFAGEIDASRVDDLPATSTTSLLARTQRFMFGLQAHDANLFWENFAANRLQLSLAYGWQVPVKRLASQSQTDGNLETDLDKQTDWQDATYTFSNSLPIQVSMQQYPQLFQRNELWQTKTVAHSRLQVFCYDFLNLKQTDLYRVSVDLRFKTLRGQYYQETIQFTRDSGVYEQVVNFELANDLQQGYEFRVRRLRLTGERELSDWQTSTKAWQDVSMLVPAANTESTAYEGGLDE